MDVSGRVLRSAAALTSRDVTTLDAVHLATALYIDAEEIIAYDRRLVEAAGTHGLRIASPGLLKEGRPQAWVWGRVEKEAAVGNTNPGRPVDDP